jgi:asparagine synthetase B (glutamine-hydrolysing)
MCGIGCCFFLKCYNTEENLDILEKVASTLYPRGPDGSSTIQVTPTFTLLASVLALRGYDISLQPRVSKFDNGSALCWNGEIFGGSLLVRSGMSDTDVVLEELRKVSDEAFSNSKCIPSAISKSLSGILGPYSFIFWHAPSSTVCFGRDPFGRRSLLLHSCSKSLIITSTSPNSISCCVDADFEELPPYGIYTFILKSHKDSSTNSLFTLTNPLKEKVCLIPIHLVEWSRSSPHFVGVSSQTLQLDKLALPITNEHLLSRAALLLLNRLSEAVRVCVTNIERPPMATLEPTTSTVSILFSGGLDSMMLAALAHRHLPLEQSIDLLNVCFSPNRDSPDRAAAISGMSELKVACPGRHWNLVLVNDSFSGALLRGKALIEVLSPAKTHMDFNIGSALWSASNGDGILSDSTDLKSTVMKNKHVRYGLSSRDTVSKSQSSLSTFNSKITTPSDVDELAFDSLHRLISNVDIEKALVPKAGHYCLNDPDEITNAFYQQDIDLRTLCEEYSKEAEKDSSITTQMEDKEKNAKLVPILESHVLDSSSIVRSESRLCKAIRKGRPCKGGAPDSCSSGYCKKCCLTVALDVACSVHKNARSNQSTLSEIAIADDDDVNSTNEVHHIRRNYISKCRVVLVGIGADELMGGYGRHRTAFFAPENGGWKGLRESLDSDINRIWLRNMGRDDRVIGSLGKEARHPFLDECVVSLLRTLPLPLIVEPRLPHGVGDKQILRAAASLIGLRAASVRVKRAMHFGCRIAKQANIASFGSVSKANGCGSTGFDLESLLKTDDQDEVE